MKMDRDDPRLTAYIMGELDDADTKAVEEALAEDDELRRFAEELRGVATMSQAALTEADGPALTNVQRDAIMAEAESAPAPQQHWLRRASVVLLPVAACALFVASIAFLYGSVPAPPGDAQVLGKSDTDALARPEDVAIPAEVKEQMQALGYFGDDARPAATEPKDEENGGAFQDALAATRPEEKPDLAGAGESAKEFDKFSEFDLEESEDFDAFDYSAGGGSASGVGGSGGGGGGRVARARDLKDVKDTNDDAPGRVRARSEVAAKPASEPAKPAEEPAKFMLAGDEEAPGTQVVKIPPKYISVAMNGSEISAAELLGGDPDTFTAGRPQPEPKPAPAEESMEDRIRLGNGLKLNAPGDGRNEASGVDDVEMYQAYIEAPKMEQGEKLARRSDSGGSGDSGAPAASKEQLESLGYLGGGGAYGGRTGGGYGGGGHGGASMGATYGGAGVRDRSVARTGAIEQRTRLNVKPNYTCYAWRPGTNGEDVDERVRGRAGTYSYDINGDGIDEEIPFYTKPDGQPVFDYLAMAKAMGLASGADVNGQIDSREWSYSRPGSESYAIVPEKPFSRVLDRPLSTFSIDVDTASYTNIRRFLNDGTWPPPGAVRLEEMVNYFSYSYPEPTREHPFGVNIDVGPCPWTPEHRLARIGLRGREIAMEEHEGVNLVFLLDVSGSMRDADKLPLLKEAMTLLVKRLGERDRVAIVTYRDTAQKVLDSTPCDKRKKVLKAIKGLKAGGSTNGGAGIDLAYEIAGESFIASGINRVILATDGDFNVGTTENDDLVRMIKKRAEGKVFLTVLGFGTGNIKDDKLEALADKGNGSYHYIDSFKEARRVLAQQLAGTLATIAKDVKIQVEFNPAKVGAYRLIGYENRTLAARDFNDDKKDAGEIGSGHTVTALYELMPPGDGIHQPGVDPLKYQRPVEPPVEVVDSPELMTVKLRYKQPEGDESKLVQVAVTAPEAFEEERAFESKESQYAAAVAAFGMVLRGSPHAQDMSLEDVIELAESGKGRDPEGERAEFIDLVVTAKTLRPGMDVRELEVDSKHKIRTEYER